MRHTIQPAREPIQAHITLPSSSCITNRALLLASLADGVSELSNIHLNDQTRELISGLRDLGIIIQLDEDSNSCIIAGANGRLPKKQANLLCPDHLAISTFLLTACATSPGVYYVDGGDLAKTQPISDMLELLSHQGAQVIPSDAKTIPFTLIGTHQFHGGNILFNQSVSNHTASALLMLAPFAKSPFTFSAPYLMNQPFLNITTSMMAEFGVLVHHTHEGQFTVPTPQRYQPKDYMIEPDFSLASYFFAAAALTGGEMTIPSYNRAISKQPDIKFLSILEKMGCQIINTADGLTVKGCAALSGIDISMRDFSDNFLSLVAIAPFATSPTKISHIGHMRHSESHQIDEIKSELTKIGIQIETGDDWIKIFPSKPHGGTINTFHDSHIAMTFAVIGLKVENIVIDHAECITEQHPNFFVLWEQLTRQSKIDIG